MGSGPARIATIAEKEEGGKRKEARANRGANWNGASL